ncbi:MAG: cob(I)yrinic acid a,c-diamide adenosyltransferase [Arenicellales bacterium]|nr:cob(I)yrinic acid a,c-diamide adenosyltransferase [Arenicellales bacterium]
MGHRLSKITTRTGDDGSTGLGDGSRVAKDSERIEALGAVDELNSSIGMLLAEVLPEDLREPLLDIQHSLFDLGGELSIPGYKILSESDVSKIETHLEEYNKNLPSLKDFVLPGGSKAAALCHVARSTCRRAERRVVTLSKSGDVSPLAQQYLNRLSDLLFVLARHLNRYAKVGDVIWQRERSTT